MGSAVGAEGSPPQGLRGRILLVDDDVDMRRSLGLILEDQGYQVEACADGGSAWELLRAAPTPDLMILDLVLPGMDGWQLRARQRADPQLRAIPVLAISGDASAKAAAIDAAAFLAKPFPAEALLGQVDRILRGRPAELSVPELHDLHRLALLGSITANIEHQLRNPLAFLLTNTRLACDTLVDLQGGANAPGPERSAAAQAMLVELSAMLNDARVGAERIHAIVEAMGMMARASPDPEQGASLDRVLAGVVSLTSGHLRRTVAVTADSVPSLVVRGDESCLIQVLVSLLLTQLAHDPDVAGEVSIAVRALPTHALVELRARALPRFTALPGARLRPRPEPDPAAVRGAAFEAARGLALCRSLLEPFGGQIDLIDERERSLRLVVPRLFAPD